MTRLTTALLLAAAALGDAATPEPAWTEHRRALLADVSQDPANAAKLDTLQRALQAKGFLVIRIGHKPATDGVTYERWLRSIPTLGVSLFYYLGNLETETSPDGKTACFSMQLGGYNPIPPARDPSIGRPRKEDKPWLSLERLAQKLGYNRARANLVVIDCLGIKDKAGTQKKKEDLFAQASGQFRGELYSSFQPGKAAFHPSLDPPRYGPFLAEALTRALQTGTPLPPRIDKLAYTVVPRDTPLFALKHAPAEVCAPPETLLQGRFAGDQWVDRNGFCFVWCPPGIFLMGDPAFEDAQPTEVTLSKGFWMGKYETLGDEAYLFNSGGTRLGGRHAKYLPPSIGNLDASTTELDKWQTYLASQGMAYADWTYDHPTEAEWEYACRAGSKDGYPSAIKDLGQYGNFADRTLFEDRETVHYIYAHREAVDGYGRTFAPIGQFRPNPWGLHDMLGNLAELCSTYYTEQLPTGTDPNDQTLPDPRGSRHRISRGGSWCSPPEYLHAAFRNAFTGAQSPHAGMRLILRQGERITRSRTEIAEALQAKLDAEKQARQKK